MKSPFSHLFLAAKIPEPSLWGPRRCQLFTGDLWLAVIVTCVVIVVITGRNVSGCERSAVKVF